VIITDPLDYRTAKAVSFSWLKLAEADEDLFYRRFVLGQVPDEEPDESRALAMGTAAHCLVLEGEAEFDRRYAIAPATYETVDKKTKAPVQKPWNKNASLCDQWELAQAEAGKTVVSAKEAALLRKMRGSLEGNKEALDLLTWSRCELAIRRDYPSLGFARQGRLDALNLGAGCILDVKTIENITDRARVREQRKYHCQLAYYQDLAQEEFTQEFRCGIVWLEKAYPHRCALEWLSPELVEYGRASNAAALTRLAERFSGFTPWETVPAVREIGPSADMIWQMDYA
jgi:hypothetical protein